MHLLIIDIWKIEIVLGLLGVPALFFGFIIFEMIKEKIRENNPPK
jgi:hypothetical protein